MSKLQIIIVADTNDADYVTEVSTISEADLKKIKPLIKAISKFEPYKSKNGGYERSNHHNYPLGECCRLDLGEKRPEDIYPEFDKSIHELFQSFCPYGEYGIHTIESVTVAPLTKKRKLL